MTTTPVPRDLDLAQLSAEAFAWVEGNMMRIAVAAIAALAIVSILYAGRLLGKRLSRSAHPWSSVIGRAMATMRLWFIVTAAIQIVAVYAHAPADVARTVAFGFTIAAVFQASLFLREIILGYVDVRAGEADPSGGLGSALGLIRVAVTVGLFILAVVLILSNLGVDVTGIVAGLGVGGIAIGLAAQGIFSDLFAALSILFDKPFRRGDFIRWDTSGGTVEHIGLASTRLRALTGEEIIISNRNLLAKELLNVTMSQRRRISQPFSLVYQTTPEQCAELPAILKAIVERDPDCHFLRCVFEGFGPSGLDFILTYDVGSHEIDVISAAKHAVNVGIVQTFAREGLVFAYPTQVTYTAAPDGELVMPWPVQPPR